MRPSLFSWLHISVHTIELWPIHFSVLLEASQMPHSNPLWGIIHDIIALSLDIWANRDKLARKRHFSRVSISRNWIGLCWCGKWKIDNFDAHIMAIQFAYRARFFRPLVSASIWTGTNTHWFTYMPSTRQCTRQCGIAQMDAHRPPIGQPIFSALFFLLAEWILHFRLTFVYACLWAGL